MDGVDREYNKTMGFTVFGNDFLFNECKKIFRIIKVVLKIFIDYKMQFCSLRLGKPI